MKPGKIYIKTLLVLLVLFSSYNAFSESSKKSSGIIQLNREFYSEFYKKKALERDLFLNEMQGAIVQGVGYIESIDKIERYHRQVRITAVAKESSDIDIRLFIFADNEEYLTLLQKGDYFDFKGQFVVFTPLNSRRDAYIFDVILEEGALSVK